MEGEATVDAAEIILTSSACLILIFDAIESRSTIQVSDNTKMNPCNVYCYYMNMLVSTIDDKLNVHEQRHSESFENTFEKCLFEAIH